MRLSEHARTHKELVRRDTEAADARRQELAVRARLERKRYTQNQYPYSVTFQKLVTVRATNLARERCRVAAGPDGVFPALLRRENVAEVPGAVLDELAERWDVNDELRSSVQSDLTELTETVREEPPASRHRHSLESTVEGHPVDDE
jgi:hypothetical protein